MGFTLPLFLDAARRKYPPNEGGKHKERGAACKFHTAPICRCYWEEIPPMIGG